MNTIQRGPLSLSAAALSVLALLVACAEDPETPDGADETAAEEPGSTGNEPTDDDETASDEQPGTDDVDWGEQYRSQQDAMPDEDWPQGELTDPAEETDNPTYHEWGDYEEVDETTLRMYVFMGNPNCYGLQYEVDEREEEVAVAVISGNLPGVDECTDDGHLAAIDVELGEPLDDREVVDLAQEQD